MSGAPIISGTIQLPKPPISAGITMKNTMISPCPVISTLNTWFGSPRKPSSGVTCVPVVANSARNTIDISPPTMPNTTAKTMYIVPMSLWLVEQTQRRHPVGCAS